MELMNLTKKEFQKHLEDKTLKMVFIGMSNTGKSYKAKILKKENDFFHYHVDGKIIEGLNLKKMEDITNWLGMPNSAGFEEREKKYLELEDKFTKVENLNTNGKNLVFDTTGSVIYIKPETINWLRKNCLVINIDITEDAIEPMVKRFFEYRKPVMWNGNFKKEENQTDEDALRESYSKLLKKRLKEYRKIANINIPASELFDKNGNEILEVIKKYLK